MYEPCFRAEGLIPRYFIDNAPDKRGTVFQGAPVIGLDQARDLCRNQLILVSSENPRVCGEILRGLRDAPIEGAKVMTVNEYVFGNHADEVLAVYDSLEDDFSKEVYANMLLARMNREEQRQEFVRENQYFGIPEFTFRSWKEVFVDCGAYVGDTIEKYLEAMEGVFDRIYAFEPNRRNYEAMRTRVERIEREWAIGPERICLENKGVGAESANLSMDNFHEDQPSLAARFVDGAESGTGDGVPVITLDEYFANQRVSFLKADIESYEYSMLRGAAGLIRRDTPKIAVCIYHNPCDMYRIALELKKLVPAYHLAVRQHHTELSETVLYAWI